MKARVKATGEIGIVSQIDVLLNDDFISFSPSRIELLQAYADASPKEEPDYWTRLEHQYAGMAMQAMLTSPELMQVVTNAEKLLTKEYAEKVAIVADKYAHALVEKMKEERK